MDKEVSVSDVIRPIWQKKYELIFASLLIFILTSCAVYLISEKINHDAKKYHIQDIKFNPKLDQKYFALIEEKEIITKSYLDNELDPSQEGKEISLINHSSRYDAMKENIIENTAEVFVRSLDVSINKKEKSMWETYLNLDTNYFQLVFYDPSLTEIESKIVITSIIRNFNDYISDRNYLKAEIIGEIAFDPIDKSLLYINNRLQEVNNVINDNSNEFKIINFDAQELNYKSKVLMAHIFNQDPSPLGKILESKQQKISQNESLKTSLEDLYDKFYVNNVETNLTNIDAQLTVDSVSQLIDLGKDFSQLNNKMELLDAIYDIDLNVAELENSIFELKSIQKLYLKNYMPLNLQQIYNATKNIIINVNSKIETLDRYRLENGAYIIGNTFIYVDDKFKSNTLTIIISIVLFYFIMHTISIYFRKYNS